MQQQTATADVLKAELTHVVAVHNRSDDQISSMAFFDSIDPTETWAGRDFRNAKSIVRRSLRAWYPPRHCMGMPPEGRMAIRVGRRESILTVTGAMAAWPLTARAQQAAMPAIAPHWSQSIGMVAIVGMRNFWPG